MCASHPRQLLETLKPRSQQTQFADSELQVRQVAQQGTADGESLAKLISTSRRNTRADQVSARDDYTRTIGRCAAFYSTTTSSSRTRRPSRAATALSEASHDRRARRRATKATFNFFLRWIEAPDRLSRRRRRHDDRSALE